MIFIIFLYVILWRYLLFFSMLFFEENKDTYRTLSEENIKLQAEVMHYKVQRKKRPV